MNDLANRIERMGLGYYDGEGHEPTAMLHLTAAEVSKIVAALRAQAGNVVPRTPTEAMLIAARDWSQLVYGKPVGNAAATGCWQAMLDAAQPVNSGQQSPPMNADLLPTPAQIEPILDDYLGVDSPHYEELRRRCAQRIFDLCVVKSGVPIGRSNAISREEQRGQSLNKRTAT